jgi:hypothetical protein
MKSSTLIMIGSLCALSYSQFVFAISSTDDPAAVVCYKTAMGDAKVLTGAKEYDSSLSAIYPTGRYHTAQDEAVRLCQGTSNGAAPVLCYKVTMNDPTLLVGVKAYDVDMTAAYPTGRYHTAQDEAVSLCRGTSR